MACTCTYATAENTKSVRAGFELGGYVLKQCNECFEADNGPEDFAPGEWEAEAKAQLIEDNGGPLPTNDTSPDSDGLLAEAKALDEAYASAGEAEGYDRDLLALVAAAKDIVANPAPMNVDALQKALDQFEPWLEQDEDPRSMGWVDDQGRP